jgi:molybdate transport system substrate-binding protein
MTRTIHLHALSDTANAVRQLCVRGLVAVWGIVLSGLCLAETPVIAVASNLNSPMTEIAEAFKAKTGESVRLSFGASGNLSRQIVQGAPYEIFISAGREYIDFLLAQGISIEEYSEYVHGKIVFYIPANSQIAEMQSLKSIINALMYQSYRKIAIANPEHAPYGVAAVQAMQSAGVWAMEKNRVILAESVSQVVPYALSGNVDVAVIPYSFILQNDLDKKGKYFTVPDSWYESINQYISVFEDASEVSVKFNDFLRSDTAIKILERYGYIRNQ